MNNNYNNYNVKKLLNKKYRLSDLFIGTLCICTRLEPIGRFATGEKQYRMHYEKVLNKTLFVKLNNLAYLHVSSGMIFESEFSPIDAGEFGINNKVIRYVDIPNVLKYNIENNIDPRKTKLSIKECLELEKELFPHNNDTKIYANEKNVGFYETISQENNLCEDESIK